MSLSNTTENAALKMFLQGTDPSYRVGATQHQWKIASTFDLFVLFSRVLSKTHIAEHSKKPIKIKAAKKSIRQVFGEKQAQKNRH